MNLFSVFVPIIAMITMSATYPIASKGFMGLDIRVADAEIVRMSESRGYRSFSTYKLDIVYPRIIESNSSVDTKASLEVKHHVFRKLETGDKQTIYYVPDLPSRVFLTPSGLKYPWMAFYVALLAMLAWTVWLLFRRNSGINLSQ